MVKINWTSQAKNDLISIAEYIAKDSQKFAKIQIKIIRSRTNQLIKFPNSGRIVPEISDPEIREIIIGNYRLIYRTVSDQQIDILAVHHSARKL